MRLAVFVFSIILVFSTTYAHAIVWLPAVSGAVVRTAAGHYIKVASKKALAGSLFVVGGYGANFAANYCKKNKEKCKDILGDTVEYFFDDDNNDCPSGQKRRVRIQGLYYKDFETACNLVPTSKVVVNSANYQFTGSRKVENQGYNDRRTCNVGYLHQSTKTEQFFSVQMSQSCYDETDISRQENEELAKKIVEHLSDDDVNQIINNYSKEIEINIDKYCATAGACAELEQAFGDEVMNNKGKYDIDRINKDNCEVKNNKIVSCDNAKIDKDDDDSDTPRDGDDGQDGQDGDDSTKPKDKDKPIKCDSSPFHKKICDFIEWTQTDDDPPDTKLDIEKPDTPKNKDPNINFVGSCPAPYTLDFVIDFGFIGSKEVSITLLDTPKLCNFLDTWVKPIMLVLGPLHAIYILGGSREI